MTVPPVAVEITGLTELKVSLRQLRKLEPMRAEVLEPAARLGQAVAKGAAPESAGQYNVRGDIRRRVTSRQARVFAQEKGAKFIEYGRRAGAPLPPLEGKGGRWSDHFRQWADAHGIPRNRLYVIARAIARRGIKGRFFMRAGREAVRAALPGYLANCARALEAIWGKG